MATLRLELPLRTVYPAVALVGTTVDGPVDLLCVASVSVIAGALLLFSVHIPFDTFVLNFSDVPAVAYVPAAAGVSPIAEYPAVIDLPVVAGAITALMFLLLLAILLVVPALAVL
jgi:hypothetical protein